LKSMLMPRNTSTISAKTIQPRPRLRVGAGVGGTMIGGGVKGGGGVAADGGVSDGGAVFSSITGPD